MMQRKLFLAALFLAAFFFVLIILFRVDLLPFVHGVLYGHVAELLVHAAHHHVGLARHACVYGAFCERFFLSKGTNRKEK